MNPDFRQYTDEQVDAAVRIVLDEVDLPSSYAISIRSLVRSRSQSWRNCCGGSCNPCVGRIEEAVDRARQLLLEQGIAEPAHRAFRELVPTAETAVDAPPILPASSEEDELERRNWGLDYA